jgi:hypothetical protein
VKYAGTYSFVENVTYSIDQDERRFRLVQVVGHSAYCVQVRCQTSGYEHHISLELRLEHFAQIRPTGRTKKKKRREKQIK